MNGRNLPNLDGDKLAWRIGMLEALRMAVGLVGQVDRGSLEPTDHGLDLNPDILGKLLRAEVGLLELQDELIDLGLVASATALDVMHPRPSPGSDRIGNHGVRRLSITHQFQTSKIQKILKN